MKQRILAILSFVFVITMAGPAHAEYNAKNKRDPFWPLVTSTGAIISYDSEILTTDMVLEGIIVGSGGNNLAIINGIIVKPKERIGQHLIAEITKDSVILIKGKEEFELHLTKED